MPGLGLPMTEGQSVSMTGSDNSKKDSDLP
jgi:hypothetical protein